MSLLRLLAFPGHSAQRNDANVSVDGSAGRNEMSDSTTPRLPSMSTTFQHESQRFDSRVALSGTAGLAPPPAPSSAPPIGSDPPSFQSEWSDWTKASPLFSNLFTRLKMAKSQPRGDHDSIPMHSRTPTPASRAYLSTNDAKLGDSYGYVDEVEESKDNLLGSLISTLSQGSRPAGLTLVWRNLAIQGTGVGAKYAGDMLSVLLAPVALRTLFSTPKPPKPDMLQPSSGIVHPGETLLVLGRPESGCSVFLKALASYLDRDCAVRGEIRYSYLHSKDIQGLFVCTIKLSDNGIHQCC